MKSSLIYGVLDLLNMFPYKDGVSDTLSPSKIAEGRKKVDMGQKMISFGSYAMVHIGTTNTARSRRVPEIALKASNDSGGYHFMNIFAGK